MIAINDPSKRAHRTHKKRDALVVDAAAMLDGVHAGLEGVDDALSADRVRGNTLTCLRDRQSRLVAGSKHTVSANNETKHSTDTLREYAIMRALLASKIAACISSILSCAHPTTLPGVRTPPVAML